MNSLVQKIKERLPIEEVISSYLKLEKSGANFKARCPFHQEKTPSFFVSPTRGSYYCFGCGAKGDIFTFVEEFEGLDFKGALKLLAKRAGVPLEFQKRENPAEISEKEKLYEIMEKATLSFQKNLNQEVLTYLKERGVTEKTVQEFRIGYALPEWHSLERELGQIFQVKDLEKAGLIKKTEKGYYDRFRGRIMFPLADSSGRIIAFSGRIFPPEEKEAKYLNSPETLIFKKSTVLFGIDKAKEAIRKNDFSIIVEGQFDLLLSRQAGFRNTVATLGTALSTSDFTEEVGVNNLGIIKRISQNIIFVFDSDKAGFLAALRAAGTALALEMNVKAADIKEGLDPADLILEKGSEAWKKTIREAKHVIEFLLDKFLLVEKSRDPLKTKLLIEEKILPFLGYIKNPVKKSHFISLISNRTGLREEDIRESLRKKSLEIEEKETEAEKRKTTPIFRKDYILRRLLGIILWQQSLEKSFLPLTSILAELSRILETEAEKLLLENKETVSDLIFEAEVFYSAEKEKDLLKDVEEMLLNLEEEQLKNKLTQLLLVLKRVETEKDQTRAKEILKEIDFLNQKIQTIKSGRFKK